MSAQAAESVKTTGVKTNASTIDAGEIERFSRIAEQWWDEKGKFKPLHKMNPLRLRYIRDQVCKHFGREAEQVRPLEGLNIVDIGCGGGLIAEPMARMGADVLGIDAAEKNIKVAALHAEQMGLEIDYRCTSAEEIAGDRGLGIGDRRAGNAQSPKPNAPFDVVLALEIVEHVADVGMFLNACAKLVKPGGLLFMSTLNRTVKSYGMAIIGAEYVLRWLPRGTHDWKKFLKPSELLGGIRAENLHIEHLTGMIYNPLKDAWTLSESDLDVNYMVVASKG